MSKLGHGVTRLGTLLLFACVVAWMSSSSEASIYLGRVSQSDAHTDPAAIDYLVDPDPGFTVTDNEIAKHEGTISGIFGANFTVTEADGLTPYDPEKSYTAQWTLDGVPEIDDPIYYITKVSSFRDVWQFDVATGDTKTDLGNGLFTYTSVVIPTDPPGPYSKNISHVSVFATEAVPEPSTLIVWSALGACAVAYGRRRRHSA